MWRMSCFLSFFFVVATFLALTQLCEPLGQLILLLVCGGHAACGDVMRAQLHVQLKAVLVCYLLHQRIDLALRGGEGEGF